MQKVLSDVHRKFVEARRIQAIVETPKFVEAYKKASKEDLEKLDIIIEKCDPEELNEWVKGFREGYDYMTKTELRFEAMKKRVKYYSRKSREELVTILKEMEV